MGKNDGGSAFPVKEHYNESQGRYIQYASDGMTLRDYFAAKAMAAAIANSDRQCTSIGEVDLWIGSYAYAVADAMLSERAK